MPRAHTYVLGINAYDHDVSACLLRDGEILVAITKERLTRVKHAMGSYNSAVTYCLETAGIGLDDLALIVRNSYVLPVRELERRLCFNDWRHMAGDRQREAMLSHPLYLSQDPRIHDISHHLAHAYSAFALCPFERGAVMVVDGVGSYRADVSEPIPDAPEISELARESESHYRFEGTQIEATKKVWLQPMRGFLSDEFFSMAGLGAVYSRVSQYAFGSWNKCGEVMGLSAFGRSDAAPALMAMEGGNLSVPDWTEEFRHPWLKNNDRGWEKSPHRREYEDLSRRVQDQTEEVLLERARQLHAETGERNLCMAGGVALNCVANGRLQREGPFDEIWVPPAAGDEGIAIGCAYYGHLALLGKDRPAPLVHSYLGRAYADADVDDILKRFPRPALIQRTVSQKLADDVAAHLARGDVIGWFQGGSEFGPRALGNRSLLADPRGPDMKDRLNARVKFRQDFRPFAPVILEERVSDVFETDRPSPFMLFAHGVKTEWQDRVPAIVHVDGTARIQTVNREQNPRLHALLTAFCDQTGVPLLLNTSFNVKGEPIIETPEDALRCFLKTGIDTLVLHDTIVRKRAGHRLLLPIEAYLERVRSHIKAAGYKA